MTGSFGLEGHPEEIRALLESARRMAQRWCETAADADDIAQEAVIRLVSAADRPRNAGAWLAVVTRRLCNRHRLRERARSSAEQVFAGEEAAPPRHDVVLDLWRVLGRLGERDRRLIERVIEGRHTSEIAAEFGCAHRDVGQMVARARRKAKRIRDDASENLGTATPRW